MAKFTLTEAISGGDIMPDVTEARVTNVRYDYRTNQVDAQIELGSTVDGIFKPAPYQPFTRNLRDICQDTGVLAAWNAFARAVFLYAESEAILPDGVDSD